MPKTVHLFDETTGEYLGPYEAQESPLEPEVRNESGKVVREQQYIIPVFSTDITPPAVGKNEVAIFNREVIGWGIQPNFRGETWFRDTDGSPVAIEAIGAVPAGLVRVYSPPAPPAKTDVEILAAAKEAKIAELSAKCALKIVSGFVSSSLGALHVYPSQAIDQSNLIGAVTASMIPSNPPGWSIKFYCADSTGLWGFRSHTPAEIQHVLSDGVAQREAYSSTLNSLANSVTSAQTLAEVAAIVW